MLAQDEQSHEIEQLHALEEQRGQKEQMDPRPKAVLTALGPLAAAAITLITVFDWFTWSAAQTALVTAESAAMIGLIAAVVAHFYPATPKEPVAVAATVTAFLSATLALGSGFNWWTLTQEEISAVAAVLVAVFGVGGAWLARGQVFAGLDPKKK